MNFEKMFGFNTVNIGNDKEYKRYMITTIIIVLISIGMIIIDCMTNDNAWWVWLLPVFVGIITICFIAYS
jgi:hypothetical protein